MTPNVNKTYGISYAKNVHQTRVSLCRLSPDAVSNILTPSLYYPDDVTSISDAISSHFRFSGNIPLSSFPSALSRLFRKQHQSQRIAHGNSTRSMHRLCEEKKESYGPQFSEAYSKASHINNSIPRKEKDPGSFTLPCFINNICFDNALVDLGASTKNALWIFWARGDDEVELFDEESSDPDNENLIDEDDVTEIFRIDTNVFDFETPTCRAFKEFNYLLQIDPDVLTKDIDRFKTYEEYKDDWIYEWNEDIPWWTFLSGQLVVGKMMDIAMVKTCLEHLKLGTHSDIKIWSDEEYVAIKECEYDDLTKTNEDACRAYQEIFRSMDEGWVVTRAE
ncbi:hypothetical protein Tco_0078344 [Tanacetum coccineum]